MGAGRGVRWGKRGAATSPGGDRPVTKKRSGLHSVEASLFRGVFTAVNVPFTPEISV